MLMETIVDDRQAFKFGFISRCLDGGLADPAAMTKAAQDALAKAAFLGGWVPSPKDLLGGAKDVAGLVKDVTLPVAAFGLAAPPVLGAALGHLGAKATDLSDSDVDEAKQQEVIDEYRRQAERLRREGALRRYAAGGRPPRRAGLL